MHCTDRQTEQKRCLLEKYLLDIYHQNSNRNTKYYLHIALNAIVFVGGTVHLRFAFPFKEERLEDRKKHGEIIVSFFFLNKYEQKLIPHSFSLVHLCNGRQECSHFSEPKTKCA